MMSRPWMIASSMPSLAFAQPRHVVVLVPCSEAVRPVRVLPQLATALMPRLESVMQAPSTSRSAAVVASRPLMMVSS